MRHIFLPVTLLFFKLLLIGQPNIYFNKTYDIIHDENAYTVEVLDDGYMMSGWGFDSLNKGYIYISKLDLFGSKLFSKRYGNGYYRYWEPKLKKLTDTTLAISFYRTEISNTQDNRIFFGLLDLNGDTLWMKEYNFTAGDDRIYNFIRTKDDGFALLAEIDSNGSDPFYKTLLIKTDSAGNMLWYKIYGQYQRYHKAYNILETDDNGFIFVGYKYYNIGKDRDIWIVKTDSLGSIEWQKFYGGNYKDGGFGIIRSKEGGYLITGAYDSLGVYPQIYKPWLIKIDNNGNIQWDKVYHNILKVGLFQYIHQNSDSSYTIMGGSRESIPPFTTFGTISKIDQVGNMLWYREYNHSGDQDYFWDFSSTPDNGFIIAGATQNATFDAWLVKVDSFGCDTAGCQKNDDIGIDEPQYFYPEIFIYPNPTSSQLSIEIELTIKSEVVTEIYDIKGRLIYTKEYDSSDIQDKVDVTNWPKGIYLVRITAEGEVLATKKVIVQ